MVFEGGFTGLDDKERARVEAVLQGLRSTLPLDTCAYALEVLDEDGPAAALEVICGQIHDYEWQIDGASRTELDALLTHYNVDPALWEL